MRRALLFILALGLLFAACNYPATERSPDWLKRWARNVQDAVEDALEPTQENVVASPEPSSTAAEPAVPEPDPTLTALETSIAGAASSSLSNQNFTYQVQSGTPLAVSNFVSPQAGCNYTGVAGQVFGLGGTPKSSLVIEVTGTLGGKRVYQLALTGSSPAVGPGGYAIKLADRPVASQDTFAIRLLDLKGVPLTKKVPFNTYGDCSQNLVLINLTDQAMIYFPLVGR